jgi:hypothetical protein
MGPLLLAAFIVIELIGPVAVLVWHRRLINSRSLKAKRRGPHDACGSPQSSAKPTV